MSQEKKVESWLTTSWDDGHPLDMKVADLLDRYGCKGTFFSPITNREGKPVMVAEEIRELALRHEIGSHSDDHTYLDTVPVRESERQIVAGKQKLEDMLGQEVKGFCYPGGKFRAEHVTMVSGAGFEYARTSKNAYDSLDACSLFQMPVTIQFYPHGRDVLLRNYLSGGDWLRRYRTINILVKAPDLLSRLRLIIESVAERGGVVHVWGHSWELGDFDGWKILEAFLQMAVEYFPPESRVHNLDLARRYCR